jgi:hypothetical protein
MKVYQVKFCYKRPELNQRVILVEAENWVEAYTEALKTYVSGMGLLEVENDEINLVDFKLVEEF